MKGNEAAIFYDQNSIFGPMICANTGQSYRKRNHVSGCQSQLINQFPGSNAYRVMGRELSFYIY